MILFIHPRRGLFQLTKCHDCGHSVECDNCSCKLTTYRVAKTSLELVCHQCQSYYSYPLKCPNCSSQNLQSKFGGIDNLVEILEQDFNKKVIRLDNYKTYQKTQQALELEQQNPLAIWVTNRVFDPAIVYSKFSKIIFIQAENLLASPDYLVQEEVAKSLAEIFLQIKGTTEIVFDTSNSELEFFQNLINLNSQGLTETNIQKWYSNFLEIELATRKQFGFPPFVNLLLLTTQEKDYQKSLQKLIAVQNYLEKSKMELPEITWSKPYQAKFLKRKGMFSHHLLLKFPKNYEHYKNLQKIVLGLAELYKFQIRLNPRHLF